MKTHREHGQVIYILAIGIITLLGFSALAIDGARLFSERRNAQGASDTAAFTAAAYIGQYQQPTIHDNWTSGLEIEDRAEQAALDRVRSNGYTGALYNPNGVNDRLRISIREESEFLSSYYLIRVFLISEVQPIFAQLIYPGEMLVNVESHAIVLPKTNIAFGQALYSLNQTDCKTLKFSGTSDVNINGSGIYAASNCTPNAIDFGGTAAASVSEKISTPGGIYDHSTGGYSSGGDLEGAPLQPFPKIPTPDCSAQPIGKVVDDGAGTVNFFPGVFNAIMITSDKNKQIFHQGLYCITKSFKVTNGNITGNGVTFYLKDGADATILGGVLDLRAPMAGEADDGTNTWDGMLFYLADGNWTITGGAGTYLEGTIYSPGGTDPSCEITGSGLADGYNLQLVCDTISLIGGAGLNIDFDGTNAYAPPVLIDLIE